MNLKAKIEAIIYAAEEPVTVDQILAVVQDEIEYDEQQASAALTEESASDGVEPQNEGPTAGNEEQPETNAAAAEPPEDLQQKQAKQQKDRGRRRVREVIEQLIADYELADHGIEIRQLAGGYRISTKPEHHDVIPALSKTPKPPITLFL